MNRAYVPALLFCGLAACGDTPGDDPLGPPTPLGSITVRWRLENRSGEEVDCGALGITGARVRVGGAPVEIACGDQPLARFGDLLPGRYPVFIQLLAAGAVAQEFSRNVEINGDDVEVEHTFPVMGGTFGRGTMEIRWFIDGINAAQGCLQVGGAEVRIEILEGPTEVDPVSRPCLDTRVVLEDVRQGNYRVVLSLRDAAGERIGFSAIQPRVQITQNTTETVLMDVVTALPDGGEMTAFWTVNSSVAAEGCAAVTDGFVEVAVRTDISQSVNVGTATAACRVGGVALEDLPIGRTPAGVGLRATFRLFERTVGTQLVDSVILRDVVIQPSVTATVSVDFDVR